MKSKVSLMIFGIFIGILSNSVVDKYQNGSFQLISSAEAASNDCGYIFEDSISSLPTHMNILYSKGFRTPSITQANDGYYLIVMCKK